MSGFRQMVWAVALLIAGGAAVNLHAQSVLGEPKDAHKVFASTCSACHKSPQGLAKSGQVAGFLRQHYTTSPEMSAAMAAYLVAAGNAPPSKKGQATAAATPEGPGAAPKQKSKKHDQLSAVHPNTTERPAPVEGTPPGASKQHTLRGKQRHIQPPPAEPAAHAAAPAEPAGRTPDPASASGEQLHAAVVTPAQPATPPQAAAPEPAGPPPVVLDIPLPEMPTAPPSDLTQSAFSSSPVP